MTITVNVNGKDIKVDADPEKPLLWILREELGLTGTKFGCGAGICGACMVHLDGDAVPSCMIPLADIANRKVRTIEGLSPDRSHPIQKAWIAEQVPQCGYCQSGMIMSAVALTTKNAKPTNDDIDAALANNLCRCGTYPRIKRAIHRATQKS